MVDSDSIFDERALDYDADLDHALSVTGENKDYFARARLLWLRERLAELGEHPRAAMDFGCGTGTSVALLLDLIGVESVVGIDNSPKSLEVARSKQDSEHVQFLIGNQYEPAEQLDLVFSNGVFHHIPLEERFGAIRYLYNSLKPGGLFAFWENNPWNPGTRHIMSRTAFDRDAITLSAREAGRLVRSGGFEVLRTDFLFIFPRALHWLRGVEPLISRLPIGAQYQVMCHKPRNRPRAH